MTLILYDSVNTIELFLDYYDFFSPTATRMIKKYASQTDDKPRIAPDQPMPTEFKITAKETTNINNIIKKIARITQLGGKVLFVENHREIASMGYLGRSQNTTRLRTTNVLPITQFFSCDSSVLGTMSEAEDGTTSGVVVTDSAASARKVVELGAQNEYVYFAITQDIVLLPETDYTLWVRVKDSNQVAADLELEVYNQTDSAVVATSTHQCTGAFAWYSLAFTIDSGEVGDVIRFLVRKDVVTANTISVDLIAFIEDV